MKINIYNKFKLLNQILCVSVVVIVGVVVYLYIFLKSFFFSFYQVFTVTVKMFLFRSIQATRYIAGLKHLFCFLI